MYFNYEYIKNINNENKWVYSLISYKNNLIVGSFKCIQIFNISNNFNLSKTIWEHYDSVTSLKIYKNLLISGSYDKSIKIFDIDNDFVLKKTIKDHISYVIGLAIHNNKLISGSFKKIKIFDINDDFKLKNIIKQENDFGLEHLIIFNNFLIVGFNDYTIKIYDVINDFKLYKIIKEHKNIVKCLCIYNQFLISGSWDYTIKVFDIKNKFKLKKTILEHEYYVDCLITYNNFLVSGSWDKTIKIYDINNDFSLIKNIKETNYVTCFTIYNDFLLFGCWNKSIKLLDLNYILNSFDYEIIENENKMFYKYIDKFELINKKLKDENCKLILKLKEKNNHLKRVNKLLNEKENNKNKWKNLRSLLKEFKIENKQLEYKYWYLNNKGNRHKNCYKISKSLSCKNK